MKRFLSSALALLVASVATTQACAVGYVFTNIADNTTAAPSGIFTEFGLVCDGPCLFLDPPAISGNRAAFHGFYNGGEGIFTGSGGPLTTIATTSDTAAVLHFETPAISGDTVAFEGRYVEGTDGADAIFRGNGGPLTTIVKSGDAAPVGQFSSGFYGTSISGDTVAFAGSYSDIGTFGEGIFTGSGGPLTSIALTGHPAPTGVFDTVGHRPSISGNTVAFSGSTIGGNGIKTNKVFTSDGGTVMEIAKSGDDVLQGTLVNPGSYSINGNIVAFVGFVDDLIQNGIFVSSGGPITTIVRTGDPAPMGTFTSFREPSIGGMTVAFRGSYSGGSGIFTGSGGPLSTVIKTGDPLFGSTVTALGFQRFGLDADDGGNLAFNYLLADGRQGVAVASVVPEPSLLILAGIASAVAGGLVRVRRRERGD